MLITYIVTHLISLAKLLTPESIKVWIYVWAEQRTYPEQKAYPLKQRYDDWEKFREDMRGFERRAKQNKADALALKSRA